MCKEEVLAWGEIIQPTNHRYHAASYIYAKLKNQPIGKWNWQKFLADCNIINPDWSILLKSFSQLGKSLKRKK